jgi:hypothetical protein
MVALGSSNTVAISSCLLFNHAHGVNLRRDTGLEALDLGPLPRLPLRDLDVGLGLQALDLGVGGGRLPGDLDLRLCGGDAGILRRAT